MIPARSLARMSVACGALSLLIYLYPVCAPSFPHPHPILGAVVMLGVALAGTAFFLGERAWTAVKKGRGTGSDRSLALLGQGLAGGSFIIAFLLLFVFPPATPAPVRAKAARAMSDMRNLAIALEVYHQDHEVYPPAADEAGKLILLPDEGPSGVSAGYVPWLLTTPLAYLSELPSDTFHRSIDRKEMPFRYATNGTGCWILASNGPDEEINVKVSGFPELEIGDCSAERLLSHSGAGKVVAYDASNGTLSPGDIIRTGP